MEIITKNKKWVSVGILIAFLSGVGTLYATAETLGFSLDRPAWHSEVVATQDDLIIVAGLSLHDQLMQKQREELEEEDRIDRYKARGETEKVSRSRRYLQQLKDEMRRIREVLERLNKKKG